METQKLIALLRSTMDPNERKAAEDQLLQVRNRPQIQPKVWPPMCSRCRRLRWMHYPLPCTTLCNAPHSPQY